MQLNLQELPAEIVQAKQRYGIVGNAQGLIAAVSRAIQVAPIDLLSLIHISEPTRRRGISFAVLGW